MPGTESEDEAFRWFAYAQEDLSGAQALLEAKTQPARQVCWFAQQAAEKAFKALLILHQIEFPRTHDLDVLRNLLPPGMHGRKPLPDVAELSEWAVEARYPGNWREPNRTDAERALAAATAVLDAVKPFIYPEE